MRLQFTSSPCKRLVHVLFSLLPRPPSPSRQKARALLLSLRALVAYARGVARWKRRKDIVVATRFRRHVVLLKATLALSPFLDARAFISGQSLPVPNELLRVQFWMVCQVRRGRHRCRHAGDMHDLLLD